MGFESAPGGLSHQSSIALVWDFLLSELGPGAAWSLGSGAGHGLLRGLTAARVRAQAAEALEASLQAHPRPICATLPRFPGPGLLLGPQALGLQEGEGSMAC